jgi:hypothetical protein
MTMSPQASLAGPQAPLVARYAVRAAAVSVLLAGCGDDPSTTAEASFEEITYQVKLEPGETKTVVLSTHCGYRTLGDINGGAWTTNELRAPFRQEPSWRNGHEWATFELTLVDNGTLSVTMPGSDVSLSYEPDPDPRDCM